MGQIKPKETYYNGYHFRSRLEARWAIFFDAMGIEYRYEDAWFEVSKDGADYRYCPDFYLPRQEIFAEVKGASNRGDIPECDMRKMSMMVDYNGPLSSGIILLGNIPDPDCEGISYAILGGNNNGVYWTYYESKYPPGKADIKRYIDTEWGIHVSEYFIDRAPFSFDRNDDYKLTHGTDILYDALGSKKPVFINFHNALKLARSSRFGNGETPSASDIKNKAWTF